jgi:aspartate racemase
VPKHIGIVAVSPEGAALCYREVFRRASALVGDAAAPVITVHNEPLHHYIAALERDDWHTIGELLTKSARVLAAAGAEFCITPDNVMQHGVHLAAGASPIPWLTMTELVAERVAADSRRVVGLIGTATVMFGSTYQTLLGLKGVKVMPPAAEDAQAINTIIFRELVHGQIVESSRRLFVDAVGRMKARGAEGVILGCSEAPLLIDASNSPLPTYDAVALLAEGAVRRAVGK